MVSYEVRGKEMSKHIERLDGALGTLAKTLFADKEPHYAQQLKEYAQKQKWNLSRLPREENILDTLGSGVARVREHYDWLRRHENKENPLDNRAFFDRIELSDISGLPYYLDMSSLNVLQRRVDEELKQVADYETLRKQARDLFLNDNIAPESVQREAQKIMESSLRRTYLERLKTADLLDCDRELLSAQPQMTLIDNQIIEQLWNITFLDYDLGSSSFRIHSVDLWQDFTEPHIEQKEGGVYASLALQAKLGSFGANNEAWFLLEDIDETFPSLHPVHVTRGIIGPFECKYQRETRHLPITSKLLRKHPDFSMFRFSRQSAYAPKQVELDDLTRQEVVHQDWRDEYLVVPAAYAREVASGVAGTQVTIIEM